MSLKLEPSLFNQNDWEIGTIYGPMLSRINGIPAPEELDLRSFLNPIRNDLNETSDAFSACVIKEYQEYKDNGFEQYFSPQFITSSLDEHNGRSVMSLLKKVGCCLESDFPYLEKKEKIWSVQPDIINKASSYKINFYARIRTPYELKLALYQEGPCWMSFPMYHHGEDLWNKQSPTQSILDGHAMCCHPDSELLTDQGFIKINELDPYYKIWTRKGYKNAELTIRKVDNEVMYNILSDLDPIGLQVTKEHPVLIYHHGAYFVEAHNLSFYSRHGIWLVSHINYTIDENMKCTQEDLDRLTIDILKEKKTSISNLLFLQIDKQKYFINTLLKSQLYTSNIRLLREVIFILHRCHISYKIYRFNTNYILLKYDNFDIMYKDNSVYAKVINLKQSCYSGIVYNLEVNDLVAKEYTVNGSIVHNCAVGYNNEHVIMRNSWSKEWGDEGYTYYPWKEWGKHWEAWAPIDNNSFLLNGYRYDDDTNPFNTFVEIEEKKEKKIHKITRRLSNLF